MQENLELRLRTRQETTPGSGKFALIEQSVVWDVRQTALILCDVWNAHWCRSATARVAELAPALNNVVERARDLGVFVVHAPSDTLDYYREAPQRRLAQAALAEFPGGPQRWYPLDPTREPPLPIDDSDDGCDDTPPCPTGNPWTRQHPAIRIAPEDAISDNGAEVDALFRQRNIANVLVAGVHTNMCVLGRSFGIRSMVQTGRKVALMRDMTDTMYNPQSPPFVSHFQGTDLVVAHIETWWCPSFLSTDLTDAAPFRFRENKEM